MKDTLRESAMKTASAVAVRSGNPPTTIDSTGFDVSGYDGAELVLVLGAAGDTLSSSIKLTVKAQECATSGGTYTDIAVGDLIIDGTAWIGSTTVAGSPMVIDGNAKAGKVYRIGYVGTKQFIALDIVYAGNHATGTIAGVYVEAKRPKRGPATQTN